MLDTKFAEKYGPWALVAGASEGMGEAFSRACARRGLNVLMIARGEEKLRAAAARIENDYGVQTRVACVDLSNREFLKGIDEACGGIELGLVVYNAAYSMVGRFTSIALEDHLKEIDVNVRGPMMLCHHLLPSFMERRRGGIIVLSSMSALQGTAMVANYAATKAYDAGLAEGLWSEMLEHGVDVMTCLAGATATPNYLSATPQQPTDPIGKPMSADDVAEGALNDLGKMPRSTPGRRNRFLSFAISRLLGKERAIRTVSRETKRLYDNLAE
ncbi:MAG: SDR family NAD(P)-dependent oxidoreductase [Polyangiales bacterium]